MERLIEAQITRTPSRHIRHIDGDNLVIVCYVEFWSNYCGRIQQNQAELGGATGNILLAKSFIS